MTTAVDKWPASARLLAVAAAGHLSTALTSLPGARPLGRVRAPSLHRHYPASTVLRIHPPSASAGAGPRGFAVGAELPLLATIADFHCCALLMSRACCHHYPGGISGCVSRSLHRRRRPSPLLWRVGSHINAFEACSMFTHVAGTVRWPPIGAFSRSASGHSSPPDPPRVLPAGARVCRPGFPPGRAVHLGKAHIKIPMNDAESMPPDTGVQTSRCANREGALRSDQREEFQDERTGLIITGRKRNLAPSAAVSSNGRPSQRRSLANSTITVPSFAASPTVCAQKSIVSPAATTSTRGPRTPIATKSRTADVFQDPITRARI